MDLEKMEKTSVMERMSASFLRRAGVSPEAGEICSRLFRNMEQGDTCLAVHGEDEMESLKNSPLISTAPDTSGLLILDGQRLFTRRNWFYEEKICNTLSSMRGSVAGDVVIPEAPVFSKLHPCQREAVKMMCRNRFSILTGGPGTGKTYTIARAVKLAQLREKMLRIALAAPTGKAAARVNETMEQEIRSLQLTGVEPAVTIHSLLGTDHTMVRFKHDHNTPLEVDWVIIDEASMVDLPLMAKLLDALPTGCRLTLVGDAHQLASVEPGRVFCDLCGFPEVPRCELDVSSRFPAGGEIDRFARAVNAGKGPEVLAMLESPPGDVLHFTEITDCQTHWTTWTGFRETIFDLFGAFAGQTDPVEALKHINDCRILCALRRGPFGTEPVNEYVKELLKSHFPACPVPIMITKNDHDLQVSNGDVGVIMPGENQLHLSGDDGESVRAVPMELLPETETAFASTIHKSQGSEYHHVVIVLPSDQALTKYVHGTELLTRELLYTAVTRTKKAVFFYSGKQALRLCCEKKIIRETGLGNR